MSDLSTELAELKREITEFAVPLQTVGELDQSRFDGIIRRLEGLASTAGLKSDPGFG